MNHLNKPDFISNPDWILLQKKYNNMESILEKLNNGYPVQYLIGEIEFLNTIINVDERVLIPRFETEYLVDKTIKYAKSMFNKKIDIIDLGTGSGCIAISLAKNLLANITALDIDDNTLDLAKQNAILNNVSVKFIKKDMTSKLENKYDIIISNPPYIPYDGFVQEKVKKYEPNIALFAEDEGLYFYKKILENHLGNLNKPGLIAFEIGDNKIDELNNIMQQYPALKYKFENDLAGLPRYLFIFNE